MINSINIVCGNNCKTLHSIDNLNGKENNPSSCLKIRLYRKTGTTNLTDKLALIELKIIKYTEYFHSVICKPIVFKLLTFSASSLFLHAALASSDSVEFYACALVGVLSALAFIRSCLSSSAKQQMEKERQASLALIQQVNNYIELIRANPNTQVLLV